MSDWPREGMGSSRDRSVMSQQHRPDSSPSGSRTMARPEDLSGKTITGRVDIHPDGFGFLIAKDPSIPNIYITEESLKSVMHKDEILARVEKSYEGGAKLRGVALSVVRRAHKEFLGIYRPFKGGALVVPAEARDRKHTFKLTGTVPGNVELKAGAAVLCRVIGYPDKGPGSVEIISIIEDPDSPSNDTLRILLEAGWPREFSRAALSEAELRASQWKNEFRTTRKDIRKLPLVTIDGRDAKDFDDAVHAKKEGANYRLWVAIADVSLFVKPGSALDREAFERSTSVYFPDHVVPMLPEVLSNGVCSLNPFEERACLVCECVINPMGIVLSYEFYEGLMQSQRRMTYEDMQAFMEGQEWATTEMAPLAEPLTDLIEAYRRLRKARVARGSIELDIPEAKVSMKQDGTILDIQARERLEAHRLIEECMLCANQCTAKFLTEKGEGVYRIHERPDPRKVDDLHKYLSLVGFDVKELEDPKDFANLMEKIARDLEPNDPTGRAISTLVLRSLKQARYSSARLGHFALADDDYTHFTSPIRRYPDLMVHRLVKHHLKLEKNTLPVVGMELEEACRHCSDQERSAMDCERKLIDTKKCRYMEGHLGEEFEAWVSGVVEKGLFCQIDGHFVDGLINADALYKTIKHKFDAEMMVYVGPGKSRIGLGTRVKIQIAAVDVAHRRIDFGLVEVLSPTSKT